MTYERFEDLPVWKRAARGSAGEVRSMLCFLERLPTFRDLKSHISNLKSLAEDVSRQLRGWADSLQNSEIKGQRYLSEKERTKYQNQKEQAEFEKLLQSYTKGKRGSDASE